MIFSMNTLFDPRFVLLTILLCCAPWLSPTASAQKLPEHGEAQIQLTLNQLLGEQQANTYQEIIPADELLSWQVYMPNNNSGVVPGLVVYVSPHISGEIFPRWRAVMDQQNLIYIAADESGNRKPVNRRMVLATMAVKALAQQIAIDSERIMIAGFSGGGRVASILASQYPEAFTGALYICGVDFWKKSQTPKVDRLVQNRFVFLTGSRDFNLDETRKIYRRYLKAGALHSKLIVVPKMSHELPDAKTLAIALEFLNNP
jgi:predicted esterase